MTSAVKSIKMSTVQSAIKSAVKSVMNLMKSYKIILISVKSCWISGNHLKSQWIAINPIAFSKIVWILVKFRETF